MNFTHPALLSRIPHIRHHLFLQLLCALLALLFLLTACETPSLPEDETSQTDYITENTEGSPIRVTDYPFTSADYTWYAGDYGNTVDYLETLDSVFEKNAVCIAGAFDATEIDDKGSWLKPTGEGAFITYRVQSLACVTVEAYSKSSTEHGISLSLSDDNVTFTDAELSAYASEEISGGYYRHTITLKQIPSSETEYVRLSLSSDSAIGKVITDTFDEAHDTAPFSVEYDRTENLAADNGVYLTTDSNCAALTVYRYRVRGFQLTLSYTGEAPAFKLEVSDEGNEFSEIEWQSVSQASDDGHVLCTVSNTDRLPANTAMIRVSIQSGNGSTSSITGMKLCAPKLYDNVTDIDEIYAYSDNVSFFNRADMKGAIIRTAGTGYIVYNKNDIRSFDIGLMYVNAGKVKLYGSSDSVNWQPIDCRETDRVVTDGTTVCHMRNKNELPDGTDYIKIELECSVTGGRMCSTSVVSVYIDGVYDPVEEMRRICEKKGVTFADVFSVTHVSGRYSLRDDTDYVNEGIEAVADMGGKMVNLWFSMSTYKSDYFFNANWNDYPTGGTLVGLAKTEYYKKAFDNPDIERYSLYTESLRMFSMGLPASAGDEERTSLLRAEYDDVYALADYFLKEYNGTGKTFIIQTWESDAWVISDGKVTDWGCRNYRDYINNRQKAVNDARAANPGSDVKVYNCMEISWVETAHTSEFSLLHTVIPQTACDLYAYSCWETCVINGRGNYSDSLMKFAEICPPSATFGDNNVYIGEYGIPETEYGANNFFSYNLNNCKAIINNGYRYANYWQLFCNERAAGSDAEKGTNDNSDSRGFWLIRADGTKTSLYNLFKMLLKNG